MAHIYIYSPAGAVRDKAGFKRGVQRLTLLGHNIEVDKDALTSHERFAGDDVTRLQAISRAASSGADLTFISRGGYGITRLLPQINYKQILTSIEQGTRWMGFSDFTALQAALLAKMGPKAQTLSGAALVADFGVDSTHRPSGEPDEIMAACFDDVLLGQSEGAGWSLPKRSLADRAVCEQYALKPLSIKASSLWGGNLAVLTSLVGTPYLPAVAGGVLWFEDTGESPFRIERMLTTWLNAGILAKQKVIVLGQFTESKLYHHDRGFTMATVVARLRSQLKIPVLTGLPFGHVPTKVMLPFGKPVRLLCDGADVMLLWDEI